VNLNNCRDIVKFSEIKPDHREGKRIDDPSSYAQEAKGTRISCNLCGSALFYTIEKLPLHLVICKTCGLIFIENLQSHQFYQDLYRKRYGFDVKVPLNSKGLDKKNDGLAHWIINNLKIKHGKLRLLEVGCSAGYLLKALERQEYQVYGVEPGEVAARFARDHNRLRDIENCFFEETSYLEDFFDAILLIQTFEHVIHPTEFLCKVTSLLKNDGMLFIEVPDAMAIDGVYRWGMQPSANHLYIYSTASINLLLNKCGFRIVSFKKINGNIRIVAKKSEPKEFNSRIRKANYKKFLFINAINKSLIRSKIICKGMARMAIRRIRKY